MMQTLATTIEAKDEYTRGHSYRVTEYAALIAKELGWSQDEITNLKHAAHLHDIGKIGIPDSVLNLDFLSHAYAAKANNNDVRQKAFPLFLGSSQSDNQMYSYL